MTSTRTRLGSRNAAATVADQILSSVGNALALVCVAQVAAPAVFGVVALVFAVVTTSLGAGRGAVGVPLLVASARNSREIRQAAARSVTLCLLNAALCAAVVLGVGIGLGHPMIALVSLALPALLVQDMLRYCAIALGQVRRALVSDGLWTSGMAGVFVLNAFHHSVPVAAVLGIWVALAWIAGVLLSLLLRVDVRTLQYPDPATGTAERLRLSAVYALDSLGAALVTCIALVTSGAVVAAAVRGAGTLFGPVAVLISSLPLTVIPKLSRGTVRGVAPAVGAAVTAVSVVALAIGVGVPLLPQSVGAVVLGDTWDRAVDVMPYLGVEYAALAWFGYFSSVLQAHGQSARLLAVRLGYGGFQLIACVYAGLSWGTGPAIATALALSGIVGTLAAAVCVRLSRVDREFVSVAADHE